MNRETTLSSLAMLRVNINQGKDYLEYLRPFILQVLKNYTDEPVTDYKISEAIKLEFGLIIPPRTIQIVLNRIAKSGVIEKKNNAYTVINEIPPTHYESDKIDANRHISSVTNALIKFSKKEAHREIQEEEALTAITYFLSKFSISCIKSYLRGTALPNNLKHDEWQIVLVSRFIEHLSSHEPERLKSFMVIVTGHMIANALLCPDLQSVGKTYKNVTFYVDTPILLQAFGLTGEAEKRATDELISLIKNLEGKVCCFSHTVQETENAITISSSYIDSDKGRGNIVLEAKNQGKTKADLLLIAEKIPELLQQSGIEEIPTPPYKKDFQIDENIFEKALNEEIRYYSKNAAKYDINSVRSIYALREGKSPKSIERSIAVFVTSNSDFAKAAYKYGNELEQSREVSTVITDFSLANTSWLKRPLGASTLPEKEVIAYAYSALKPSEYFLERVLAEADKLETSGAISARDLQLLRSNHYVQGELMSLTLGDDSSLSEQSITAALNKIEAEIKAEETLKYNQESAQHALTKQSLIDERDKHNTLIKKLYWDCVKSSKDVTKAAVFMLSTILIVGIVASFIGVTSSNNWIRLTVHLCLGTFALLTLLNICLGTSIKSIYYNTQSRLLKYFIRKKEKELNISIT